jgi:hypothetical protein
MKNRCYICNIERHEFDRYAQGFENHIKNDHNLWQYLYFLVYMKSKDPTDYNGTESAIWQFYLKGKIDWFPLYKAICFSKEPD